MQLVSFVHGARERWGIRRGDLIADMTALGYPPTLLEFIEAGPARWEEVAHIGHVAESALVPSNAVQLLAPIPRPKKNVVCLGANYAAHAAEGGHAPPASPIYFTKPPTAVTHHEGRIALDRGLTSELDYEGELGVVIGIGGRHIAAAAALDHVFGYTIINDVSARDVQHGRPEKQWFLGKSFDGFCPMGPSVVTTDEIPDPHALELQVFVNDELRQSASTAEMTFSIPEIIADLSKYMTLEPGDIISTGTPSGVGGAMKPPRFLSAGDSVEIKISVIGELRNTVVDASSASFVP